MPAEAAARLLFEIFLQVICYFTARILVPPVTFGLCHVEPTRRGTPPKFKWHGVHRTAGGKIVFSADLAAFLGLIFWAAIIAIGVLIYVYV